METEETTATSPGFSAKHGRPGAGAAGALVGKFFSAHGRMVLGLCRLLLRDPDEAEDAAQQVFLSAHKALVAGAVPRDPPAWLAAIARNECRARIRARMWAPLELPELPADLPDPLAAAISNADLDALWVALSELPRRQRRAFLLRELGGLSYGELGAALGVTRPAVESLLFRARQQVRNALAGANAALVPIALRDQLARLIPDFGASAPAAAAVPAAAKVAAVTAGLGLGAAGVVALPNDHARHAREKADHGPFRTSTSAAAVPSVAASSPAATSAAQGGDVAAARQEDRRLEQEHAGEAAEQQHEAEATADRESGSRSVGGGDRPEQGSSASPASLSEADSSGSSSGDGGGRSGSSDGGSGGGGSGSSGPGQDSGSSGD